MLMAVGIILGGEKGVQCSEGGVFLTVDIVQQRVVPAQFFVCDACQGLPLGEKIVGCLNSRLGCKLNKGRVVILDQNGFSKK